MAIPDRVEQINAVEAAKAEILAAIAAVDGKFEIGVIAKAIKSIQRFSVSSESAKYPERPNSRKDITINAVDKAKTIVLAGGENSTETPYAELKNAATVTVYTHSKSNASGTGTYTYHYFPDVTVIEFY